MIDWEALLQNHFVHGLGLMILGFAAGWALGYWRRRRLRKEALGGEAREILNAEQILVAEQPSGVTTIRIRSIGSSPLAQVLVNPVAHDAFLKRSRATSPKNPLLDLHDQMGSFLLHLLQPWVCGLAQNGAFKHDIWIMAPVCEPGLLSEYRTSTVVIVRQSDLIRFLDWEWCKALQVEHGSDAARVLTLWHMAREFDRQLQEVKQRKATRQSSRYVETMYLLDLGLDMEEMPLPTKPIPWHRYESVLKDLKLT